jgi:hypothetical protein
MTSRTPNLPGVETQRGNKHVGNAVKREGMYRDAPQVLCARLNLHWLNPSSQRSKDRSIAAYLTRYHRMSLVDEPPTRHSLR